MILVLALTWLVMMNLSEGCTRDNPTWSDQPNKSGRTFGLSGNKFLVSVKQINDNGISEDVQEGKGMHGASSVKTARRKIEAPEHISVQSET